MHCHRNARPTKSERNQTLPGDHIVAETAGQVMHAVTIAAPPQTVWPWLVQMGAGRAGWYSYDWIDNGGQPSATTIVAALQDIAVGDIMPSLPGATTSFVIAAIQPFRDLVLTVPLASGGVLVSWEFALEPLGTDRTRLMVRGCVSALWPGRAVRRPRYPIEWIYWLLAHIPRWLMTPVARFGHGVMQVRQLNGIKRRAEHIENRPER